MWEGIPLDQAPDVSKGGHYEFKKVGPWVAELVWSAGDVKFLSVLVFTSDKGGYFTSYLLEGHPVRIENGGEFTIV